MYIFVFWNSDQWIKFSTTENGETTYKAINMTDEEIDKMIELKAQEGVMIEGWKSDWLDE